MKFRNLFNLNNQPDAALLLRIERQAKEIRLLNRALQKRRRTITVLRDKIKAGPVNQDQPAIGYDFYDGVARQSEEVAGALGRVMLYADPGEAIPAPGMLGYNRTPVKWRPYYLTGFVNGVRAARGIPIPEGRGQRSIPKGGKPHYGRGYSNGYSAEKFKAAGGKANIGNGPRQPDRTRPAELVS